MSNPAARCGSSWSDMWKGSPGEGEERERRGGSDGREGVREIERRGGGKEGGEGKGRGRGSERRGEGR